MKPSALADVVGARAKSSTFFQTYRSELITARPTKGYVVLWFAAGTSHRERYVARTSFVRWAFRVTCVGYSDQHCLQVAERVRALFAGYRPDPDPAASPLSEIDEDPPLIRDDVEGDVRWSVSLRFGMTTPV